MCLGLICLLSFSVNTTLSQINDEDEGSDQAKIVANWKILQYKDAITSTVKFPRRRYDSPFFCNELIPYKNGYIINSITSSPGGRKIDIRTRFYYYNVETKKISQLILPGADTIESIVTNNDDGFYYSYIKSGSRIIGFSSTASKQNVSAAAPREIKTEFDSARWIKLGFANNELYALSPNGLFIYAGNEWSRVVQYAIDDFYLKVLNYRRSGSTLPTKNITVQRDHVWFLQEVVQQRTCRLLKLDKKTGEVSDFFISLGYIDNYFKQVNDYSIISDQTILVSASRLIGKNLMVSAGPKETDVWIFNNTLRVSHATGKPVAATVSTIAGDTIFFAGINGLFMKHQETVTPLIFWENTHQQIKEKKYIINFEFVPRSLIKLSRDQFLIGGMWGGLYHLDLNKRQIIPVDDIPDKEINHLQLDNL